MTKRVLAGALLWLWPTLLFAQSLGDIARKEEERRRQSEAPVRSFTSEDVSTRGETAGQNAAGSTPATPADSLALPLFTTDVSAVAAPPFMLEDRQGRRVSLSDFRGRVVLIDFWATWCAPCRASMPKVERLHRRFGSRGLQVVGVNIEGKSDEVLEYIDDGGYSFLFVFDEGNWRSQVTQSYGVTSIPRSYLIDPEGRILYAGHPDNLSEAMVEASLP